MARKKKPSGKLDRGPFTADDFRAALALDGWVQESPGPHSCWVHPTRPGKAQIAGKWDGVRPGHDGFRGIMAQTGYTKDELLGLLNGIALD